jgi:hypothetical protein
MDPSTTLPTDPVARDVVYGSATPDGTLLFMTRNQAEELARLRAALHSAQTWGDFQSLLSARSWREVRARLAAHGQSEPEPAAPFEPAAVPGYADGTWPGVGPLLMRAWMPAEVWQVVGATHTPAAGGLAGLDATVLPAIVRVLEAHGFTCAEDDDLIARASGLEAGEQA